MTFTGKQIDTLHQHLLRAELERWNETASLRATRIVPPPQRLQTAPPPSKSPKPETTG